MLQRTAIPLALVQLPQTPLQRRTACPLHLNAYTGKYFQTPFVQEILSVFFFDISSYILCIVRNLFDVPVMPRPHIKRGVYRFGCFDIGDIAFGNHPVQHVYLSFFCPFEIRKR